MLLDYLSRYLESVEEAIRKLEGIYVERYEEEILTANRLNLRIKIRFNNGHMLELSESVIGDNNQLIHLGYRYHFQDRGNSLVFRYDNTPHFQELASYPHHKHLSDRVIAAQCPSIIAVIEEAMTLARDS